MTPASQSSKIQTDLDDEVVDAEDELEPDASALDPDDTDDADDTTAADEAATRSERLARRMPWLLVMTGLIGFAAAFALTYERIQLLLDESHEAACEFGAVFSCMSVMTTPQASVFGFPNPLIGVASFAAVTAIGMGLLAGARYRRWFWLGLQAGAIFGIGFVGWLMYQSVFVINRLCPYCMVVWAVMIPLFWYTTVYNLDRGHIPVGRGARGVVDLVVRNRGWFLFLLYFIPVVVHLLAYQSYLAP